MATKKKTTKTAKKIPVYSAKEPPTSPAAVLAATRPLLEAMGKRDARPRTLANRHALRLLARRGKAAADCAASRVAKVPDDFAEGELWALDLAIEALAAEMHAGRVECEEREELGYQNGRDDAARAAEAKKGGR